VNILLLGPPGSGKGTQGARLAERLGIPHIATGDLLRAEVAAGTELGRRVGAMIAAGDLVPDEVMLELVLPVVRAATETHEGYLLDGFPRSVAQAEEARRQLTDPRVRAEIAIYLDLDHATLVKRVLARAAEEGRVDDTPEVIENRLKVFEASTRPLVDYYRDKELLTIVDAGGTTDEVTAEILAALQAMSAS
jgi:adenylate kinase